MKTYKYTLYAFIFLFLLSLLGVVYALYSLQSNYIKEEIDNKLLAGAKNTALLLENYHHKTLLKEKISPEQDLQNIKKLSQLAKDDGLMYVYSFMQDNNGTSYFTSSSAIDEDLEKNISDIYSFDTYNDPKLQEAFQTMQPIFSDTTDKWGNFRSVYVPMKAKDGSIFVVGADYQSKDINKLSSYIKKELFFLFIPLLVLLLIMVFAYNMLTKNYERRIKAQKRELANLYETDQNTQLPNRFKLLQDLQNNKNDLNLALIDIYKFKNINNVYGVAYGDMCLVLVATTLKDLLSNNMHLYKLDADSFCIVSLDTKATEFISTIEQILSRLEHHHFKLENYTIELDFYTGITCTVSTSDALLAAEKALHVAKKTGQHLVIYDSDKEQGQKSDKRKVLDDISFAIKNQKIHAHFQPIYDLHTKQINKLESLMRLEKSTGEIVPPWYFLDIAQKAGLYKRLSKIMLEHVIKTAKQNMNYIFSLNISAIDIEDQDIQNNIFDSIINAGLSDNIILEILESEPFDNPNSLSMFEQRAQSLGIGLSIDDFGSGYANFSNLINVHYKYIKIDGSLIKNILQDRKYELMVTQIVNFAKNVNSQTIAEFVENEEIAKKLESLGVDMLQGYAIGKPSELASFKFIKG